MEKSDHRCIPSLPHHDDRGQQRLLPMRRTDTTPSHTPSNFRAVTIGMTPARPLQRRSNLTHMDVVALLDEALAVGYPLFESRSNANTSSTAAKK